MTIFISWSGTKSRAAAVKLRQWLKDVIQTVEPWMSDVDIDAGERWNYRISQQLQQSRFGIICLTRANQQKPWLLFEAGALAKTIEQTNVVPYLIDLDPGEILPGPLAAFQAKRADEAGTRDLVKAINETLTDAKLPESNVQRYFDLWWPDLQTTLEQLPADAETPHARRPLNEMVEEMLVLVRGMAQQQRTVEHLGIPKAISEKQIEQVFYAVLREQNDATAMRILAAIAARIHASQSKPSETGIRDKVPPSQFSQQRTHKYLKTKRSSGPNIDHDDSNDQTSASG